MNTATQTQTKTYKAIVKEQRRLARAVEDLSQRFKFLGTLEDFNRITQKGRVFARRNRITKKMVLEDD